MPKPKIIKKLVKPSVDADVDADVDAICNSSLTASDKKIMNFADEFKKIIADDKSMMGQILKLAEPSDNPEYHGYIKSETITYLKLHNVKYKLELADFIQRKVMSIKKLIDFMDEPVTMETAFSDKRCFKIFIERPNILIHKLQLLENVKNGHKFKKICIELSYSDICISCCADLIDDQIKILLGCISSGTSTKINNIKMQVMNMRDTKADNTNQHIVLAFIRSVLSDELD